MLLKRPCSQCFQRAYKERIYFIPAKRVFPKVSEKTRFLSNSHFFTDQLVHRFTFSFESTLLKIKFYLQ